mgnify:CR=1 FL=1
MAINKQKLSTIIGFLIAVLTAIATYFGVSACTSTWTISKGNSGSTSTHNENTSKIDSTNVELKINNHGNN